MALNKIINLFFITFFIVSCSSNPYHEGNYIDITWLQGKEGQLSQLEIEETIGSPSFVDEETPLIVYYVGAKGLKYPVLGPSINESLVVKIEYDHHRKLKKVSQIK